MDQYKRFSGRAMLWAVLVMVGLVSVLDYLFYLGINLMISHTAESLSSSIGANLQTNLADVLVVNHYFIRVFIPGSLGVGLLFALILWGVLCSMFKNVMAESGEIVSAPTAKTGPVESPAMEENTRKRLFLHLLSVLQKEGRLLDFFNEKLDQYDDAQIGAAVRNIHDNCSRTLGKYLTLGSVMDGAEGETVTVQAGFDPAAVKLVGNVTGEPPFKGVLRHKGWKVEKLTIPTLSVQENPGIIAPAEVEIE
jgi:hypothetical protein